MPTNRLELRAEIRSVLGKHVRRLRRQGLVPANIYGHGASRAIQAPAGALEHLLAHGGRRGVIDIAIDGATETALLKDLQRDPRSGALVHMEFQAVSMNEAVISTVPIRFVGEAPATRTGAILTHPKTDVRVAANAGDLPDGIEVDLSSLVDAHSAIHVGDLPQSDAYTILDGPEEILAMVVPPRGEAEAEAEPGGTADAAEPAAST